MIDPKLEAVFGVLYDMVNVDDRPVQGPRGQWEDPVQNAKIRALVDEAQAVSGFDTWQLMDAMTGWLMLTQRGHWDPEHVSRVARS